MFKYSVWYVLDSMDIIHQQIKQYSKVFDTPSFIGHVTVNHSVEFEEAVAYCKAWPDHPRSFTPRGKMVATAVNNFYAIEQPLSGGYHISLAYRYDRPFNPMELAIISTIPRIETVSICVADCRSENPNEWAYINNEFAS